MPVLGICLGHQLAAVALGGAAARNPRGQQFGLLDVGWTPEAHVDALMAPVATPRRGVQWNDDIVTALPPTAVVLARATTGEVQVARFAPTVWGVQLHPEVDEPILRPWAEHDREAHTAIGVDPDAVWPRSTPPAPSSTRPGGRWRPASRSWPPRGPSPHDRAATSRSDLLRQASWTPSAPSTASASSATRPNPCWRCSAAPPTPTWRWPGCSASPTPSRTATRCCGEIADDEGTAMRLLSVLGASLALTDHLVRHPLHWRELTDPTLGSTRPASYAVRSGLLAAVGADPADAAPVATVPEPEALDAMRVEYRRVLLRLAARDLAHHLGVDDVAAELSDLAAGVLEAALAVARATWATPRPRPGSRWWRWASAAAMSSTTSPTST